MSEADKHDLSNETNMVQKKENNEQHVQELAAGASDTDLSRTDTVIYKKADKLLLAGAAILGVIFVWLFYGKYPGISVPLFVIVFYGLFYSYTRPVFKKDAVFGWFLCVPVLLLSLTFVIFRNEALMVLNILLLPWLILLQTMLITGVNSFKWYSPGIIGDLLFGLFGRCLIHLAKPFKIFKSIVGSRAGSDKSKSVGVRVLAGLAISLPLLLILLLLLSSADMVFGKLVEKLPDFLESLSMGDIVGKTLLAVFIFFISFSYVWSLGHGERFINSTSGVISSKTPDEKRRWDPVVLITVTSAVDVLYIFFVIIQFTYLFGKFGLPEGFTYSQYARSGFFELILVSLMNMGLLAITLTYTKKAAAGMYTVFRLLNTIMIGCTLVMLLSAYYRMSLYENAYGFTFLRIMTQAFMIFLFVLFIITMAKVWVERLTLLKPYLAAAVIAFTVINYINVDAMIANKNIERYYETGKIDVSYFNSLSNDAAAELVKLAEDSDPEVSAEAGRILESKKSRLLREDNWQSFNLSDNRARKLLF